MSKIKIKVNSKLFNLELDDEFATFMANELGTNLGKENNSIKDLVNAYLNKNLELFNINKKAQELNNKLS